MAIDYDKTALSTAISDALLKASQAETDPASSRTQIADELADAIDAYVKKVIETATVTVTAPPSTINVAGSATNQTNPESISIDGTIS